MNYDIDYEIYKYISQQAESYVPLKELLKQNNLTYAEANQKVFEFKEKYYNLLHNWNIRYQKIVMLCCDLMERIEQLPENQDLQYLYFCTVTDTGLLNFISGLQTEEQKIRSYIRQHERIQELTDFMYTQKMCKEQLYDLQSSLKKGVPVKDTDCTQELEMLCDLTSQHTFLYGTASNQIYRDNLQLLLIHLNSGEKLKSVKPYLIFAVLSRKHGMMQKREHFIPNLQTACQYQKYQIHADNGKNFNNYQSYLELYNHLRRFYAQDSSIDTALCDFCFAGLSPLSEWYYQYCQPDIEIPMTLKQKVRNLKSISFPVLYGYYEYSDYDMGEFETEYSEIYEIWNQTADSSLVSQFLNLLKEGEDIQALVSELPYSSQYPEFAELFLYQLAEITLNEQMINISEKLI